MKTYIALLRGINVSGQKKIKMADLRNALGKAGLEDVQTYIQSGNIIFKDIEKDKEGLLNKIKNKIYETFTFDVPVQVFTAEEIQKIYNSNPFLKKGNVDIKTLHVTLLEGSPETEHIASLQSVESNEDEYRIAGHTIYLHCPNGYGRTKLTNTFFEKKLKTSATTRNWKTIEKLAEFCSFKS